MAMDRAHTSSGLNLTTIFNVVMCDNTDVDDAKK